jgi:DNA-directed RNA polymerase III subunit RPC3
MLSANQLAEVEAESNYEVLMERDEQRNLHRILEKTEKRRKKKKGKDVEEFDYHLKPNIHLRVNFDRFGVLMRDELIIKAAEDRWNKGAAEVVRAVLAASLQDHSVLSDSRTHNEVGVTEIVDRLSPSTHQLLVAGMAGSGSKSVPEIVSQYLSVLAGEDQMVGNGGAFLSRNTMADPGYMVEVESICTRLRASLLTELVRERLGVKAARVLAVVAKASKAGETTVSRTPCLAYVLIWNR